MPKFQLRPRQMRAGVIIILLASAFIILLWPRSAESELAKCQALYDRGQYRDCVDGLTKLLKRNPQWPEARELLIRGQLAAEQPVAALETLIFFLEKEEDSTWELVVLNKLKAADSETLAGGRRLLEEKLAAEPDLNRVRLFLVKLEIVVSQPEQALPHLAELAKRGLRFWDLEKQMARSANLAESLSILEQLGRDADYSPFAREMSLRLALEKREYPLALTLFNELTALGLPPQDQYLTAHFWNLLRETDLVRALELALELNNQDWVQDVLAQAEQCGGELREILPGLQELLPEEPRLWVLKAGFAESRKEGLALLLKAEAAGYVPDNPSLYGTRKYKLIQGSKEIFKTAKLKYIPEHLILNAALEARETNPAGALVLADWLETLLGKSPEIALLREIIKYRGPTPQARWSTAIRPDYLSIAPNGKWLCASLYGGEIHIFNLVTGTERASFGTAATPWVWSPDGMVLAAIEPGAPLNSLRLYAPGTNEETSVSLPDNLEIIGWKNNSSLFLTTDVEANPDRHQVVEIEAKTGAVQWESEARTDWPLLTPSRSLVWVKQEGNKLYVDLGNGAKSYDLMMGTDGLNVSPLDWFPSGDKLLMQAPFTPVTAFSINLYSGELNNIELPWIYSPGNWVDAKSIWGLATFWDIGSDYKALLRVNLETGKREYAGVTFLAEGNVFYASGNKDIAISDDNGITVYKMP